MAELTTLRAALASERERAERALSDVASLRAELETEREVYENTERAREAAEAALPSSLAEIERLREALELLWAEATDPGRGDLVISAPCAKVVRLVLASPPLSAPGGDDHE